MLRRHVGVPLDGLAVVDVYLLHGIALSGFELGAGDIEEIFADNVAQRVYVDVPAVQDGLLPDWDGLIEIAYKAGVTDPIALTAREAVKHALGSELPETVRIQTARQYVFRTAGSPGGDVRLLAKHLYNPLIQEAHTVSRAEWRAGQRLPEIYRFVVSQELPPVQTLDLGTMDDGQLASLSRERLLALSVAEMRAIRGHFMHSALAAARTAVGLPPEVTDVELEMLAQTWSEHCKHKIFSATISYTEGRITEDIHSIFASYIKRTTDELKPSTGFLKSVFHDNSGVVEFDDETLICFKVETHNSPSALDPYGGAITGIVGVNRDILGTGKAAHPIFNTNVLCFAYPGMSRESIPEGIIHPRRIMDGVHHGIIDGGNQSGIPTVAGAFLYDESYLGKPLVFCGTGGILPSRIGGESAWIKHVDAGDVAVMVGGRIGKDGIHGATFSSQALSEESPTSAVQIGDPITQKKMLDFLVEARDLLLFKGITDNGAGGLSSSLGEMAQLSGGVCIELERCPVKYQGLAPWEILVSESQERMSLSVAPDRVVELLELAARRDVEATVVGQFTDTGFVDVRYDGRTVGLLDLEFLHSGLPEMLLAAEWIPSSRLTFEPPSGRNLRDDLLSLLSEPNVASKEELVRQYDHEVQALSVVKPFVGAEADGPSDGAVLRPRYDSYRGLTICHGICPRYGDVDTYDMAACAVDEAVRSHIALGGELDAMCALDNFCWPDPIYSPENPDGRYKLA